MSMSNWPLVTFNGPNQSAWPTLDHNSTDDNGDVGLITSDGGTPLEGANVIAIGPGGTNYPLGAASVYSDASGHWSFKVPAGGPYVARALHPAHDFADRTFTSVS
jgi:hypothetical protein